ncbi:MAG: hypothetical protein R3343_13505 [Nitriliruptorales bacterium]|nr:hypothetical protein [Nitriliruptorales bacterium]
MMRLSRHAKNKLRWIRRDAPHLTEEALLRGIADGRELGVDDRGNVKIAVEVAGVRFTAVVDPDDELVITLWRE